MKNNIVWIDSLKSIGILAVILGHIASPMSHFIFSWHMPLFFLLSGFFIKTNTSLQQFSIYSFKRLMLPYYIFALIGIFADTIKRIVLHRDSLDYFHELYGVFVWMDMSSLINTYAFILWFLPTLFFGKIIVFITLKYISSIWLQSLIILGLFTTSFYVDLPFGLDNAMNSILWIYIGHIFFTKLNELKSLYLLLLLLPIIYIWYGIPTLDLSTKHYGNIYLNIIWALAIIYAFIFIFKNISTPTSLRVWGQNTMILFILHPYTNNFANIFTKTIHLPLWYLTLFISLALLQIILFIKLKYPEKGVLKYV